MRRDEAGVRHQLLGAGEMLRDFQDFQSQHKELDILKRRLTECLTIQDYLSVRGKAIAFVSALRAFRSPVEPLNRAIDIKLSAERELGRLLRALSLRGGDRRKKRVTLSDFGITHRESAM